MSRLIRVSVAAAIAAAAFAPAASSSAAPPCRVWLEERWVGGTTWTARVIAPAYECTL